MGSLILCVDTTTESIWNSFQMTSPRFFMSSLRICAIRGNNYGVSSGRQNWSSIAGPRAMHSAPKSGYQGVKAPNLVPRTLNPYHVPSHSKVVSTRDQSYTHLEPNETLANPQDCRHKNLHATVTDNKVLEHNILSKLGPVTTSTVDSNWKKHSQPGKF